jgi:hypothetical protein
MPPVRARNNPKTRQLRYQSTPIRRETANPSARTSLRQSTVLNYARIERIDEPIANPPRTPTSRLRDVASALTTTTPSAGEDTYMEDTQDMEDQVSPSAGRARPEHAIPIIVTLRKAVEDGMKIRKALKETTWTKQFFTITHLEAI